MPSTLGLFLIIICIADGCQHDVCPGAYLFGSQNFFAGCVAFCKVRHNHPFNMPPKILIKDVFCAQVSKGAWSVQWVKSRLESGPESNILTPLYLWFGSQQVKSFVKSRVGDAKKSNFGAPPKISGADTSISIKLKDPLILDLEADGTAPLSQMFCHVNPHCLLYGIGSRTRCVRPSQISQSIGNTAQADEVVRSNHLNK